MPHHLTDGCYRVGIMFVLLKFMSLTQSHQVNQSAAYFTDFSLIKTINLQCVYFFLILSVSAFFAAKFFIELIQSTTELETEVAKCSALVKVGRVKSYHCSF